MTLENQLAALRHAASPAYLDQIARMAARLNGAGVPTRCRQVGEVAPDFALPQPAGRLVGLHNLLRRGPVVLSFLRGEWCPFCRAEIDALVRAQPEMARHGASLIMVLPEPAGATLAAAVGRLGQGAAVVADGGLGAALLYGLVFLVPDALKAFYRDRNALLSQKLSAGSWLLPIPADYVIGTDGRIVLSYVEPDFTRRLDPAIIVESLMALRGDPPRPSAR